MPMEFLGKNYEPTLGGRDSLSIGAAKPQEVLHAMQNPSRACGAPIAELSGPPARRKGGGPLRGLLAPGYLSVRELWLRKHCL